jgi:SAM-dependent methyltransferase
MLSVAAGRLRGRLVRGDAGAIPVPDAAFDAVVAVWLLHLADDVAGIVGEVARVLRPGGMFVTTVDKDAAHDVGSDIDRLLRPHVTRRARDAYSKIADLGARVGFIPRGEDAFDGHGQAVSPRRAAADLRRGYYASRIRIDDEARAALADAVDALPDPETPRDLPRYRLVSFERRVNDSK